MAVTHNIEEMAVPLKQSLGVEIPTFKHQGFALVPPKPLIKDPESSKLLHINWPQNNIVEEDLLQTKEEEEEVKAKEIVEEKNELDIQLENNIYEKEKEEPQPKQENLTEDIVNDNWGIDDLEIPEDNVKPTTQSKAIPTKSQPISNDLVPLPDKIIENVKKTNRIGDLVACGLFNEAMLALKKQIGVFKFDPFKPIFMDIYMASSILIPTVPLTSPLEYRLTDDKRNNCPLPIITMSFVENELKSAYKLTTEGAFNDAINRFRRILLQIPMLMIEKNKEKDEAMLLIRICLEYIMALRCEVARKQSPVNFFCFFKSNFYYYN